MVRILFVEASTGGVVGGSLTGLYHLIRGLDRGRFRIDMALYEPKEIEADLRAAGVSIHQVRRRRVSKRHALQGSAAYESARRSTIVRSILRGVRESVELVVRDIPAARDVRRVLQDVRPDVVHLGNGLRANFDALLACMSMKIPVVCHVKGFEKYGARERWAATRVDILVCMTEAILTHCRQRGVQGRQSRVVYDGVDESWITPKRSVAEVRQELAIRPDAPCVVVVGNVQEWKGQGVLLDAMPAIVARFPYARALVVGGVHRAGAGYAAELQERLKRLGLADAVTFTGFRNDVVDVMNASDVIVHTSVRPEPFGRVILEGMLLGKPVVATNAGGVPELIRDGESGLLVPPGDPAALADRVIDLFADGAKAQRIGHQAQAWARERFALTRQVNEMSEIYERLAGSRDA